MPVMKCLSVTSLRTSSELLRHYKIATNACQLYLSFSYLPNDEKGVISVFIDLWDKNIILLSVINFLYFLFWRSRV